MNNLNIKSVLQDVLAFVLIAIVILFAAFSLSSCQSDYDKLHDSKARSDYYIVNYLESSVIDTISYHKTFKIVRNPTEDLTIHDSCGELIFEYKD
jgi:hypothetical protein